MKYRINMVAVLGASTKGTLIIAKVASRDTVNALMACLERHAEAARSTTEE